MNGVTDNSGSLNLALKWKKKLILQWMGTDILLAIERFKNSTIDRKYIDYATNFVDAPWMMEELKSANINTEKLHFKFVEMNTIIEKYSSISVMSYVAQNRQDFYGMDEIIQLAIVFPEIEFSLYGLEKAEKPITENIKLYGWVSPEVFQEKLMQTPIFLRLTKHDGFSLAVLEALSFGAEVITSFKSDFGHSAITFDDVPKAMLQAIKEVENRHFKPNLALVEKLQIEFKKEKILYNYVKKLKEIVSK
jgi:glycosyltransferase involved in cell wall biosynthesis